MLSLSPRALLDGAQQVPILQVEGSRIHIHFTSYVSQSYSSCWTLPLSQHRVALFPRWLAHGTHICWRVIPRVPI